MNCTASPIPILLRGRLRALAKHKVYALWITAKAMARVFEEATLAGFGNSSLIETEFWYDSEG
jgi:hypothetical protein